MIGATYSRASGSRLSDAPKNRRRASSKKAIATQTNTAKTIEPITDAVKYSLDCRNFSCPWPRKALNRTEPPMPISRPML